MTTTVRSIDKAAAGYVHHRFARALTASFVVLALFGTFALFALAVADSATDWAMAGDWVLVVALPLIAAVMFLIFLLVFLPLLIVTVGLIGAVIDVVHRRAVALVLLVFASAMFVLLGATAIGVLLALIGVAPELPGLGPLGTASLALFAAVGALIGYQLMRYAWWQMAQRAEGFRAVRGWRPPRWRLLASFGRYLGLPGFLSYIGSKSLTIGALYLGVATLNLGLLMLLALPLMMMSSKEVNEPVTFGVLGGLLLLNLLGAGNLLARMADRGATSLYQSVREWDDRAPILFLRAFDQDHARLKAAGGDPFARWPAGVGRSRTLDEVLLEHASPYGPVIAIGDPRDPTPPLGAARVFVPEEGAGWQDVVRGLAGASKVVIMCPNRGEGVQWELDLIAQAGERLRTIFLASPELDRAATIAMFARLAPDMPAIAERQHPIAAFAQDGEWRVLTARRLSVDSYTTALNAALQALFGLKGEPTRKPTLAEMREELARRREERRARKSALANATARP